MEQEQELKLILLNVGFAELNANWNWENINSPFFRIYLGSAEKLSHIYI